MCGCTDTNACVGGCYWVDAGHTLCSRCAHVSERVISKKRFEKETPGQHKHPRGEKTCSLCAKTFEGYDIFCPHCGKLLQATKSVGMESYSMQEGYGFCPYCSAPFKVIYNPDRDFMETSSEVINKKKAKVKKGT